MPAAPVEKPAPKKPKAFVGVLIPVDILIEIDKDKDKNHRSRSSQIVFILERHYILQQSA